MKKKKANPLASLPRHIIGHGKGWFKNTKTGTLIPAGRINEYLPKPPVNHEVIMAKRYDLNY